MLFVAHLSRAKLVPKKRPHAVNGWRLAVQPWERLRHAHSGTFSKHVANISLCLFFPRSNYFIFFLPRNLFINIVVVFFVHDSVRNSLSKKIKGATVDENSDNGSDAFYKAGAGE